MPLPPRASGAYRYHDPWCRLYSAFHHHRRVMTNTIELRSEQLTARVAARGAELKSLRAAGGPELIFQADPTWWEFSAPLLFPVIGKLRDGRIRHGERWIEL